MAIIVKHADTHEMIECPHCGKPLCAEYPDPYDDTETATACEATYYATGIDHVLACGVELEWEEDC